MRNGVRPARLVHLTVSERETLLAHVDPPDALDDLFRHGRTVGELVCLELGDEALGHLMQCLEQTANFAQNQHAMDQLARTLERIESGLDGTVDPGAHLVRPAAIARRYTATQGQYLAFIHLYTRLHRRPPAESDIQAYFRVSPPVVHDTLKALVRKGLIRRTRAPRSIEVLLRPHEIPELE